MPTKCIFAQNHFSMQTKEKNIILILSIAFAVIVLVIGYLYFKQNNEYKGVVSELTIDKENLASEFQDLMFEYDSLKPQSDSLLVLLDQEQQKVLQLLEELETVKATNAAKIREYKKELTTMRSVLRHYVVQIDSLNQLNKALTEENQAYKAQYKEVTKRVDDLVKEKEDLKETVDRAAQLEATNIEIETLSARNKHTRRLNKITRLSISFSLNKNITAPVGEKPIYVRITGPNDEVYFENENDVFFFENKKINYSSMRVVEYEGEELPVTIYWDVNRYLFAGNYRIDIFADANHIGNKTITIED